VDVNQFLFIFLSVVPGSEELSADEDTILTPPQPVLVPEKTSKSSNKVVPRPKLRRPKILHRRRGSKNSASLATGGRDWGERCVEVFEVIAQIGEGTYGQVYKAKDKRSGKDYDKKKRFVLSFVKFCLDVCMYRYTELLSKAIFGRVFYLC
jgi:hypothetical protein